MTDAAPLALTDEIKSFVATALETNNPMVLAAVDPSGKPLLSFRGSTVPFSDTALSLWVRNTTGGTISAIQANPNVAMVYRSATVPLLNFIGRARISEDEAERERAFSLSHEKERERDPERKGAAIIIDLDSVNGVLGFGADGPIFCNMARA